MKKLFVWSTILILVSTAIPRDQKTNSSSEKKEQPLTKSSVDAPIIWPTYDGYHQTGKVSAGFNSNGTFGINFGFQQSSWPGPGSAPGFVTPPDSNVDYLYGGAIWIGGIIGDDTLVTVGHDGWQQIAEFFPPAYNTDTAKGSVDKIVSIADNALRCVFIDSITEGTGFYPPGDSHTPLNIKVALRSYSWTSFPEHNCIIYDMVITNIGIEPIEKGVIGMYFDCDIGFDPNSAYIDDLTGSFLPEEIGYIIDNDGDLLTAYPATKIFAFKFLDNSFKGANSSFNWWIGNGNPDLDFGPRQRGTPSNPLRDFGTGGGIGTPEGDANKYYMMSFPEWDYDQIYTYSIPDNDSIWLAPNPAQDADFSDGYDTRMLVSLGSFNLGIDSSVRVIFSTFTGDFVHSSVGGAIYLPQEPETYLSFLYFDQVLAIANTAKDLSDLLLDPNLPPLGLEVAKKWEDSVELQWDAWSYDDISGYTIYLSEIEFDSLPYPGAVPPWWGPDNNAIPLLVQRTHKHVLNGLNPEKSYMAAIAHQMGISSGQIGAPVHFKINADAPAPTTYSGFAFANPGEPVELIWKVEEKENVDHFNIYKFSSLNDAALAYHPFYDRGGYTQFIEPDDSFFVDDQWYFYYSMEPYAVMAATDTVFFDNNGVEGDVYIIASADQYGFESDFTEPIFANEVVEMTRDVLLITNSPVVTVLNYTYEDSIFSFYERILQGLDYEIFNYWDSSSGSSCLSQPLDCMDWHDFMAFKLVIIDDRYTEQLFSDEYHKETNGFDRYLAYGGKLAYLGHMGAILPLNLVGYLDYTAISDKFVNEFLGIDSILYGGERYYSSYTSPPYVDTSFGFNLAQSNGGLLPSTPFDFNRDTFKSRLRNYWPMSTPPGIATFKIDADTEPLQHFKSVYPQQSLQQNHLVGVRKEYPNLNTYAYTFGYHLWYMDSSTARDLIETILLSSPSSLSAHSNIFPVWYKVSESRPLKPTFSDIYLGNVALNNAVAEIDISSVKINSTISPSSTEILGSWPGYNGSVLKLTLPVTHLVGSYGAVLDTLHTTYSVSGEMSDGTPLQAFGNITIIGKISRDFNLDGVVNIIDLNLLVGFVFRGQPLPENYHPETMDPDGDVNLLDLNELVNYLFRPGGA